MSHLSAAKRGTAMRAIQPTSVVENDQFARLPQGQNRGRNTIARLCGAIAAV
jgi:hypothetical protein